jgi:hypothetical protein
MADVTWAAAKPLTTYRHPGGKGPRPPTFDGVYIIAKKGGGPVYVGQTADFAKEWATRFHILGVFEAPLHDYEVHAGTVSALPGLQVKALNSPALTPYNDKPDARLLRQDVEHVLLRQLDNAGQLGGIKNQVSTRKIWSAPGGITLTHKGSPPAYLGNLNLGRNQSYEVGAGGAWG